MIFFKDKQVLFFGLMMFVALSKMQAMTVARPKNVDLSLIQKRHQALALKLKEAANTTPSKIWHDEDDLVKVSLCTSEFFVHSSDDSSKGICVPRDVIMASAGLKDMVDAYPAEDKEKPYDTRKPIIIPINFPISIIKETFALLKIYLVHQDDESQKRLIPLIQDKIGNYSLDQLTGVMNFIHNYKFPQILEDILLEKIQNVKQGIGFLVAKRKLNPDIAKPLITGSTVDCLTSLLMKNNLHKKPTILRNYSEGSEWTTSIACDRDGENTIEALSSKCILRDPNGDIKKDHTFEFFIKKVAMSPDATWVAIGGENGNSRIYNCIDGNLYAYPGLTNDVRTIEFSPDGTKIIFASWGGSFQVNNVAAGVGGWAYNCNYLITGAAFNSDGTQVVIGHAFSNITDAITIRNSANGTFIKSFKSYGSLNNLTNRNIFSISFSPNDKKILYIEKLKERMTSRVVLLDVASGETTLFVAQCMKPGLFSIDYVLDEYETDIIKAAFTADGKNIIMCDKKNIILCNIDNNYKIIREDVIPMVKDAKCSIYDMVMSGNKKQILLRYGLEGPGIILPADEDKLAFAKLALWTDEDERIINQVTNVIGYDSTRMIRGLCSAVEKNGSAKTLSVGTDDYNNFQALPPFMKQRLSSIFWPQIKGWLDWFFGWME